jgi:hypothetical protein
MSAEIANVSGHVLTMKVSGTLTQPELASMQSAAAGIISGGGKWRVLVLTENFKGWERGGTWDDFSFSAHDGSIERMAIVGERKWEDMAMLFTAKGLRAFPIEYFEPAQLSAARQWLDAQQNTN